MINDDECGAVSGMIRRGNIEVIGEEVPSAISSTTNPNMICPEMELDISAPNQRLASPIGALAD
jgi:hypothetical protein